MLEFLDTRTIYTIMHLFGVAIGAGGAYMSDVMYMRSTRDKRITPTELRFLKLGSRMVWVGLGLLILSGALLFTLDPAGYLASSKFIVKMVVVAVLAVNGIIFHVVHTPVLDRTTGDELVLSDEFRRKSKFIYASGAISIVSWSLALILGALRGITYSVLEGILIYVGLLIFAIIASQIVRKRFLIE